MDDAMFLITPEVRQALSRNAAVVALESTIISHGMPYPENRDTALRVEAAVRAAGAVPATIALLGGKVCVGLSAAQLEQLATAGRDKTAVKCSRRDLASVLAQRSLYLEGR